MPNYHGRYMTWLIFLGLILIWTLGVLYPLAKFSSAELYVKVQTKNTEEKPNNRRHPVPKQAARQRGFLVQG